MKPEITNKRVITYKRILNLGNYESKHLEITELIDIEEDLDTATSRVMEFVERKIRLDLSEEIRAEIKSAKKELKELKKQISECQDKLPIPEDLENGIPFNSGSKTPSTTINSEVFDPDPLRHFCSPSEIPQSATVNPNNYKRDWNQKISNMYGN